MTLITVQQLNQEVKSALKVKQQKLYQPLEDETRLAVPTDAAAFHLNRKDQTLRAWACFENGPLRPIRINGRLAWSVSEIKAILNGDAK